MANYHFNFLNYHLYFKLANVKYIDNGCKDIVRTDDIKEFQPSSVFKPGLIYQVSKEFFKAQIILLKVRE